MERAEFIKEWVKRLRSGRFNQCQGMLKSIDNSFCCLGIAEDMQTTLGNGKWEYTDNRTSKVYVTEAGSRANTLLSTETAEFLGVTIFGTFDYPRGLSPRVSTASESLASLNDNEFTFSQIADMIEWIEANNLWYWY